MTGILPRAGQGGASLPDDNLTGGWASYYSGSTPPVSYDVGTPTQLNLNAELPDSDKNEEYIPKGVTQLWDSSGNKLNLSELSTGDMIDLKFDVTYTPFGNGQVINLNMVSTSESSLFDYMPLGPAGAYRLPYSFTLPVTQSMVDNGATLEMQSNGPGTVKLENMYVRVLRLNTTPAPPVLHQAYVGFSEGETPTSEEIENADVFDDIVDMSTFIFSGNRSDTATKHPFIAWSVPEFDSNQVKEGGLYNTWDKTTANIGAGAVKVLTSETTTNAQTFQLDGLVPADDTLWTPKFNASQYVVNPTIPYDDNVRIEIKAFFKDGTLPGNMILLSDGGTAKSYVQRDTSWRLSWRSDYDTGNSVGTAAAPSPPIAGYFTITIERVDGLVSIDANGLSANGPINATASVENEWDRIGAFIDGQLFGMIGQIHSVSFTNLSAPSPVITRTLLASSATQPNDESVNGLTMVGFPDGDRWEMVRTK